MLKEIMEVPEVIRRVSGLDFSLKTKIFLKSARRIFLVGSGSSYHAGLLGKYYFQNIAGVEAEAWVASEWNLNPPEVRRGDFAILISQSGETREILSALKTARELRMPALVLVNSRNSILGKKADILVDICAGTEKAVPATKSFVAEVIVLFKLAILLALFRKRVSVAISKKLEKELVGLGEKADLVIRKSLKIRSIVAKYKNFEHVIIAGSGLTLPLAYEMALKIKESAVTHAEGMVLGEVRHGPMALAGRKTAFIFLVDQTDRARAKSLAVDIRRKGSRVWMFDSIKLVASDGFILPSVPKVFSPIVFSVALQLVAYWFGVLRGYNVDKPRNLAKSVTVE